MRFFSLQAGGLRGTGAGGVPGQAGAGPQHVRAGGVLGQASSELIMVLGILLIVILVFVVLSTDTLSGLDAEKNQNSARDTVQRLARSADYVYSQGEGASLTVNVIIPSTADISVGKSYIGKPWDAPADSESNTINMRVAGNDIYAFTYAPLSGAFPAAIGNHKMRVTSHGSYVSVGSGLVDISPSSLFLTSTRDVELQTYLMINTPSFSETANSIYISIGYSPVHGNVGLTIDDPYVIISGDYQASMHFTPTPASAGIYNWVLQVNATACNPYSGDTGCASDRFEIPVTLEIEG